MGLRYHRHAGRDDRGIRSPDRRAQARLLGSSEFVLDVIKSADDAWERTYELRARGIDFRSALARVAQIFSLAPEDIMLPGKQRYRVAARSVLCYWAVREIGMTATALARRLRVSQPAISNAVLRGERVAKERRLFFDLETPSS